MVMGLTDHTPSQTLAPSVSLDRASSAPDEKTSHRFLCVQGLKENRKQPGGPGCPASVPLPRCSPSPATSEVLISSW